MKKICTALSLYLASLGICLQAFAQADSADLILSHGLFEVGGGLSFATSAVREQGRNTAYNPPQSRLHLVAEPELNYFFNSFISGGIQVGLDYANREDALPTPRGTAVVARQSNSVLTFGIGGSAYQGILRRLFLYERLGFDFGSGSTEVNLLDVNDKTIKTGTNNTGTTRLVPEVGIVYFVRSNVALKAMLAYRISWVTVGAFEDPGNDLDIWLPRGNYLEQGLLLKVGLSFFFKGPVKDGKAKPSLK